MFPRIGGKPLQNGWFIMVPNPMKIPWIWGVKHPPLFFRNTRIIEDSINCIFQLLAKGNQGNRSMRCFRPPIRRTFFQKRVEKMPGELPQTFFFVLSLNFGCFSFFLGICSYIIMLETERLPTSIVLKDESLKVCKQFSVTR